MVIVPITSLSLSIGTTTTVRAPAKSANSTVARNEIRGGGPQVGDVNHLLAANSGGDPTVRMEPAERVGSRCGKCRRRIVERGIAQGAGLDQRHRPEFRPANARRVLQHLIEHRAQIARRGTDDLQHFGRCSLLLEGFLEIMGLGLHLVEQADIADRDDGLVGERLQEFDLLVVEGLHFDAAKRNDADRLTLPQKGYGQNRTLAVARQLPTLREIIALQPVYIMNVLRSLVDES